MMPEAPLLSVFMPTKNRARYIERAIKSVLHEIETDYPNTEFWVIDGASTDGTLDILKRYESRLRWISGPDKGVSEAVNKALPLLTGKYVWGIGDDDRLCPGAFSTMIAYAEAHPDIDILLSQAKWLRENDDGSQEELNWRQPEGPISYEDLLGLEVRLGILTPESGVTKLSVFQQFGGFDLSFHYFAYWEFWLRALHQGAKMHVLPTRIMERIQTPLSDGVVGSTVPQNRVRWNSEIETILDRYGGWRWVVWRRFSNKLGRDATFSASTLYYIVLHYLTRLCKLLNFHPRLILQRMLGRS